MQLYHAIATNVSVLPEGTIRGMYTWAKKHKDVDLLANLTKRTDLPVDILGALKKESAAKIRVAYLSREDVTAEELAEAVNKEKRVTVLTAIAESTETPPKVLGVLGDTGNVKVNLALLRNVNTPEETLTKALRHLWTLGNLEPYQSNFLLKDRPHLHNIAALNIGVIPRKYNDGAYGYIGDKVIQSEHLTKEAELNIVNTLIVEPIKKSIGIPTHSDIFVVEKVLFAVTKRPTLSEETLEILTVTLNGAAAQNFMPAQTLPALRNRIKTRVADAENIAKIVELLHAARKASSAQEIDTLAKEALQYTREKNTQAPLHELTAALDTLSTSEHASEETIVSLIPHVSLTAARLLVDSYMINDNIMTEVLTKFDAYIRRDVIENLSNPTAVIDELASRLSTDKTHGRSNLRYSWNLLLSMGRISEKGLMLMPWEFVGNPYMWTGEYHADACATAEKLLTHYLGENLAAWEVFSTLAENSDKTLGELLETTEMLAEGL